MLAWCERLVGLTPLGVAVWAVSEGTVLPEVLVLGGALVISTRWILLAFYGTIATGGYRVRWRLGRMLGLGLMLAAASSFPGEWLLRWWTGTPWLQGSDGWLVVAGICVLGWVYSTGDPVVISAGRVGGCLGGVVLWPAHAARALLGYGVLPFFAAAVFHPDAAAFDHFMFMVLLELVLAGRTAMIVQAHARDDARASLERPDDVPHRF